MFRPFRPLWILPMLGALACSHAPELSESRVSSLDASQLGSVHAGEQEVSQAQQALAQQEQERQRADQERDAANDDRKQVKSQLDAAKAEVDRLKAKLDTADARVDAADAQIKWNEAKIAAAKAEIAHQKALLEQAKYQALSKANDPSVQGLKAEDFSERVRKTDEDSRDAQSDATKAQQRFQNKRESWERARRRTDVRQPRCPNARLSASAMIAVLNANEITPCRSTLRRITRSVMHTSEVWKQVPIVNAK
jgi:chromosome segregation ATPase